MHRKMECDQPRFGHGFERKALARYVDAEHIVPVALEPGSRRGQPERLPSHFVSGDQRYLHIPVSIILRTLLLKYS